MTPDSRAHHARFAELAQRFEAAVALSFGFLHSLGFERCPALLTGMDDLRDAMVSHRYTRGARAVDVHFSFLTFQIQVVLMEFASAATCERAQPHVQVVDFEAWLREHKVFSPKKLTWMRKETLWEEMCRSYNQYARRIDEDMEGAVELFARRLEKSELV